MTLKAGKSMPRRDTMMMLLKLACSMKVMMMMMMMAMMAYTQNTYGGFTYR